MDTELNSQKNLVDEDIDANNNKEDVSSDEGDELRPRHSKFCHSKDISEKEESLRNCRHSTSSQLDFHACKEKKSVTFNNSFPVYLDISKKGRRIREIGSDSDDGHFETHFTDVASETDLLSISESEFFHCTRDDERSETITAATSKLTTLLHRLQSVWLDVHGTETVPEIKPTLMGDNNLLEVISMISFVTERLEVDYRKFMNVPSDLDKLIKLESSNQFLKDQLESSKMMKTCMESEMKYLKKENNFLNEEVKQLTYQMAVTGSNVSAKGHLNDKSKPPKTEIFYRNPHQSFLPTDSNSSAVTECEEETSKISPETPNSSPMKEEIVIESKDDTMQSQNADITNAIFTNGEKLENDFDCIMDYVKLRGTEMDSLQSQLQNYDEEIHGLRNLINSTDHEKQEILSELEILINEQKALLRERDHYESILKLILNEKASNEFNLQELLQNLLGKLNTMSVPTNNMGISCQTSLLEGAIQTVQEQNSTQRDEISKLKNQLSSARISTTNKVSELETAHEQLSKQLQDLSKELLEKDETNKSTKDEAERKYENLEELYRAVIIAKTALEKSVADKDEEVNALKDSLESLQKMNQRQHNKLNNLHKTNVKLVKEIEELKHNMEQLASIISQLRSNFKEQKSQWNERLRVSSEEASQSKEQCRWLQSQIEHMNLQLVGAHERIKAHECDKSHLAQQVLLAEEERKIVDRKLQELRAALQGDTVLREALIERNETLQGEINRLRRAKLASLAGGTLRITAGEHNPPPSEMSKVEDPMAVIQIIDYNHNNDKLINKRNRYASTSTSRRGNDVPRTAVSLHNGGSVQGSND